MGSSSECRVPQLRHRRLSAAQLTRLVLSFFDLLCQLDPGNRYRRVVESLESQHGPGSLLHSPMVLLHKVVQVLAPSSHSSCARSSSVIRIEARVATLDASQRKGTWWTDSSSKRGTERTGREASGAMQHMSYEPRRILRRWPTRSGPRCTS